MEFRLSEAYPNPFNAVTRIPYQLPVSSRIVISIHDINGHQVARLVDKHLNSGYYSATWNAVDFPAGVYYVKLEGGGWMVTRKAVLVK